MKKYNYRWIWADQDDIYTNKAYSLENIIEEIIEYYYSGDVESISIEINENDDTFAIHFIEAGETHEYECRATPDDVAQFLNELAEECDRQDTFEIKSI